MVRNSTVPYFKGYYVFVGPSMDNTQIIIKSERHSSRADFDQERELLRDGVDHLIIEEAKEEAQYRPHQYWFGILMWIMTQFFFRIFYQNNGVLKDIARAQGANVEYTRESNASVVENSGIMQQLVATAVISIFIFLSAYIGAIGLDWMTHNWNYLISVTLLPLAVLSPIYIIRDSDSDRATGNRDEIIADKITNPTCSVLHSREGVGKQVRNLPSLFWNLREGVLIGWPTNSFDL